MSTYKLSQGIDEGFEFSITDPTDKKELRYNVRYPSASDFEPTKDIDEEIDRLKEKINSEDTLLEEKKSCQTKIDELEQSKSKIFYNLVTPIDHDVEIEALLNRVNVRVVRNFNEMIKKELGA